MSLPSGPAAMSLWLCTITTANVSILMTCTILCAPQPAPPCCVRLFGFAGSNCHYCYPAPNYCGVYHAHLSPPLPDRLGLLTMRPIHRIPCFGAGFAAAGRPITGTRILGAEVWVLLLEKAVAKFVVRACFDWGEIAVHGEGSNQLTSLK